MKTVLAVLALATLSGCSTYSTHLRTGCVWSCTEWTQRLAEIDSDPNYYVSGAGSVGLAGSSGHSGISAHTYNLPSGSYMAIRSGSTTSVIQTSRSR
jgi:hypothetical protein